MDATSVVRCGRGFGLVLINNIKRLGVFVWRKRLHCTCFFLFYFSNLWYAVATFYSLAHSIHPAMTTLMDQRPGVSIHYYAPLQLQITTFLQNIIFYPLRLNQISQGDTVARSWKKPYQDIVLGKTIDQYFTVCPKYWICSLTHLQLCQMINCPPAYCAKMLPC